jgi:hypothetical protein
MKTSFLFFPFFLMLAFSRPAFSQMEIQKGIEGRTFFDTARVIIKEAYEYKLRYTVTIDPRTNEAVFREDPEEIKNGLYIRYRIDGTIECTGYYKNDIKCGHWKYMDHKGELAREEQLPGECVITE